MSPAGRAAEQAPALASWEPPAIVAATAVAIVAGFYLGGPGLGMAVGALSASAIVILAVRRAPRPAIVPAALTDLRRHVLIVAGGALEDPRTVEELAQLCVPREPGAPPAEVRVLVPAVRRFLDRWSGERAGGRALAQRRCVLSLASLIKAGVAAQASVGDEDVVLAVEDVLRTFPATDVILVGDPGRPREEDEQIAAELRDRLQTDFLHMPPAAAAMAPAAPTGGASAPRRHGDRPGP